MSLLGIELAVSRNGRWIASGDRSRVQTLQTKSGRPVATLTTPHLGIEGVSDDGKLVLLSLEAHAELWDIDSGRLVSSEALRLDSGAKPTLDPGSPRWAISSWRYSGESAPFVQLIGAGPLSLEDSANIGSLVFLPNDRIAGCGHGRALSLWDASTGQLLHQRPDAQLGHLHTSADGSVVGGMTHESTFTVFDALTLETRCELRLNDHLSSAHFSPDGRSVLITHLISREERQLEVFSLAGPKPH